MNKSFLKYAVLLFSILFVISNYTCKKSTTEPKDEEPEINIKVLTENILDNSGSYDFGNVTVGETSTAVTFTIENVGTETLNLSGTPIVQLSGTDSSMFTIIQQPSSTVIAGASTSFSITFNPTTAGTKTASISISNNDTNENPYTITLNGAGVDDIITNYEIASTFASLVPVNSESKVYFSGPIESGTKIREANKNEDSPVLLSIPETSGTYYVFIVDDGPHLMFDHPMRYAWVDVESKNFSVVDASYHYTLYRPNIQPTPFVIIDSLFIDDTRFTLLGGEGGPDIQDDSHKPIFSISASKRIFSNIYFNPQRSPIKKALVMDTGDKKGVIWDDAEEFYESHTQPIANWVSDNGFETDKLSQYWGNEEKRFTGTTTYEFIQVIMSYGNDFTALGKPDFGCDEFFLYITGHANDSEVGGGREPSFDIYNSDGSGDIVTVKYYQLLKAIKDSFPDWVKVTIFIDACYSGQIFTDPQSKNMYKELCDNLCALTIFTSCDHMTATDVPDQVFYTSGTEHFLKGADKDLDGDGKIGDIQDRFKNMDNNEDNEANDTELFKHCPEGQSWCSLDGPTYCESQEHLYNLMGFFSYYFVEEPCSAVEQPPDDRTVTNSWGLIQDILYSMVSEYGLGILREDISVELWLQIALDFPFDAQGMFVGPWPLNFKLNKSNITFSSDAWIILFHVMHDEIPIADPVYYYQYGFVFDRDGNANNNYQPHPSYPYDFFQDTDYWVVASYAPGLGWFLDVSDATNSVVTSVESEARIIIVGNTLIVFIPRSEFLTENIGYRVTAYKHPGDWGMTSGDWDGDVQPPVADGLNWVDVGPE